MAHRSGPIPRARDRSGALCWETACFEQDDNKRRPASVGSYPAGKGPFGTLDQAGSVWEWCLDVRDAAAYQKRAEQGALHRIALPEQAEPRFMELVGAVPPNDLDDGEAATLTTAEAMGLTAAVDERKGRRVASSAMPQVEFVTSVDLFRCEAVQRALGDGLADAVFSVLFHARMRALDEHREWVVSLVGEERAARCGSLRRRG